MVMLITLQTIQNGFFKCKIKPIVGASYHREFTAEALHEYLMGIDFYCETKGYQYKFIVPDAIKKMAGHWLESLATTNNKK
jgi:hypothetical protein